MALGGVFLQLRVLYNVRVKITEYNATPVLVQLLFRMASPVQPENGRLCATFKLLRVGTLSGENNTVFVSKLLVIAGAYRGPLPRGNVSKLELKNCTCSRLGCGCDYCFSFLPV